MNNLPIENQVCSLEQAKKLAELLGEHAPKSLWVWGYLLYEDRWELIRHEKLWRFGYERSFAAYSGDELNIFLTEENAEWTLLPRDLSKKVAHAIKGLIDGSIKKEFFRYGIELNDLNSWLEGIRRLKEQGMIYCQPEGFFKLRIQRLLRIKIEDYPQACQSALRKRRKTILEDTQLNLIAMENL